jgi:site-specific recombinase XerD
MLDHLCRSMAENYYSSLITVTDGKRLKFTECFFHCKRKAGIEKAGDVHVFARHTLASVLVANGCDLTHVEELLRHKDFRTTLRYAHIIDKTLRERYNQYLRSDKSCDIRMSRQRRDICTLQMHQDARSTNVI